MPGCRPTDFWELADQLPAVTRENRDRYWRVAADDNIELLTRLPLLPRPAGRRDERDERANGRTGEQAQEAS